MFRVRLWEGVLDDARVAALQADRDYDAAAEMEAEEEYAQRVYESLGYVIAQLWQVEEGIVHVLTVAANRHSASQAELAKLQTLTFGRALDRLQTLVDDAGLGASLREPMDILSRALASRNRLTHGRVRVGVSRRHPDAPPEPVIVLVSHKESLEELDEHAEMELASTAIDALAEVAVVLEGAGVIS